MTFGTFGRGLALALAFLLAACGASEVPEQVHFNFSQGEVTAVVHNQHAPLFLAGFDTDHMYANYMVRGHGPTKEQQSNVTVAEKGCRIVATKEQPNPFVTVLANGAVYGALGAAYGPAVGAANKAFSTSVAENTAAVGISDGLGGVANGIISTGGVIYSFENCARTALEEFFPGQGIKVLQKSPY